MDHNSTVGTADVFLINLMSHPVLVKSRNLKAIQMSEAQSKQRRKQSDKEMKPIAANISNFTFITSNDNGSTKAHVESTKKNIIPAKLHEIKQYNVSMLHLI